MTDLWTASLQSETQCDIQLHFGSSTPFVCFAEKQRPWGFGSWPLCGERRQESHPSDSKQRAKSGRLQSTRICQGVQRPNVDGTQNRIKFGSLTTSRRDSAGVTQVWTFDANPALRLRGLKMATNNLKLKTNFLLTYILESAKMLVLFFK